MADEKGNTPQDRRAVALSDPDERRHFVNQYVKEKAGIAVASVEAALDEAALKIGPSEDREKLNAAVSEVFGSSDR